MLYMFKLMKNFNIGDFYLNIFMYKKLGLDISCFFLVMSFW